MSLQNLTLIKQSQEMETQKMLSNIDNISTALNSMQSLTIDKNLLQ